MHGVVYRLGGLSPGFAGTLKLLALVGLWLSNEGLVFWHARDLSSLGGCSF